MATYIIVKECIASLTPVKYDVVLMTNSIKKAFSFEKNLLKDMSIAKELGRKPHYLYYVDRKRVILLCVFNLETFYNGNFLSKNFGNKLLDKMHKEIVSYELEQDRYVDMWNELDSIDEIEID